jgi:hypothetical protein
MPEPKDKPGAKNLLAAGYKEHPVPRIHRYDRLFMKRIADQTGAGIPIRRESRIWREVPEQRQQWQCSLRRLLS